MMEWRGNWSEEDFAATPNGSPVSRLNVWSAGKDIDTPPPRGWLLGNTFCRRFLSSLFGDGGVGKTGGALRPGARAHNRPQLDRRARIPARPRPDHFPGG